MLLKIIICVVFAMAVIVKRAQTLTLVDTGSFDPLFKDGTQPVTPNAARPDVCNYSTDQKGVCVPPALCRNSTVATHGDGLIRRRFGDACKNAAHVCCRLPSDHSLNKFVINTETAQNRIGCGWRNEEGSDRQPVAEGLARYGEFPWTVCIQKVLSRETGRVGYLGGGSLIHPRVVLTTAHILDDTDAAQLLAFVGCYNVAKKTKDRQIIWVASVVKHDTYNNSNFVNDVALLFLKKAAMESTVVRFACLPSPAQAPAVGAPCLVSGWWSTGQQYNMAKLEAPFMDRGECVARLQTTELDIFFELDASLTCAGGVMGVNTCVVNGGSPLVCPIPNQPGRYAQYGMVSWGMTCGEDGMPTVYTDVAQLRPWIDMKMKEKNYEIDTYSVY